MSEHQALMFRQPTDDVTVFLHGGSPVSATDPERLAARGVRVVPGRVSEVVVREDRLVGARLEGGEVVARDALVVATVVTTRSEVAAMLGLDAAPVEVQGQVIGTAVPADPTAPDLGTGPVGGGQGDLADGAGRGLGRGRAGGGAMINADLIEQETAAAVAVAQAAPRKAAS